MVTTADAPLRVFLAAPFVQFIHPSDGVVDPLWRARISALRDEILAAGHAVFNAHHNEAWGAQGLPPAECVPSDFRGLQAADLVLAYVGSPPSTGVALELGWASALRKPVVLLLDRDTSYSPMITALGQVSPVLPLTCPSDWTSATVRDTVGEALAWVAGVVDNNGNAWRTAELDPALAYHRLAHAGSGS
jgi:nucleoside 2-deoxyribosyltransferase